jgi:hypothetical protein
MTKRLGHSVPPNGLLCGPHVLGLSLFPMLTGEE